MRSLFAIFGLLFATWLFACKTSRTGGDCPYEGVVKDMNGLDGCGLMIELADGTRLQPVELADSSVQLKAGQQLKFGYTELKDRMSTCMAGKMVRIECLKVKGQ